MRNTLYSLIASAALFAGCTYSEDSSVRINPGEPTVEDSLECHVEGHNVPYNYSWYVDGQLYKTDLDVATSKVSKLETEIGEEWLCEAHVPQVMMSGPFYLGNASVYIE